MTIVYTDPTAADMAAKEVVQAPVSKARAEVRKDADGVHADVRVSDRTFHLMHSPFANLK